jgi:hypothetical protein
MQGLRIIANGPVRAPRPRTPQTRAAVRQAPEAQSASPHRLARVAGRTQEALYSEIDLELSWSEDELPQVERTKHVHSLHPYLGKFIPQLVEVFLRRYFSPKDRLYDPFVGSGTTLVEATVFGAASVGCDISAFNCLLSHVKTGRYGFGALELGLKGALEDARRSDPAEDDKASAWLRAWYSGRALTELLAYRAAIAKLEEPIRDVGRIILSRSARSARQTTHFDLDFPRAPQLEPYWCHKHRRECRPVDEAFKFLRRYTLDTIRRLREFSLMRGSAGALVTPRGLSWGRSSSKAHRGHHVTALSRVDRLSRATSVRVRTPETRGSPRGRDWACFSRPVAPSCPCLRR